LLVLVRYLFELEEVLLYLDILNVAVGSTVIQLVIGTVDYVKLKTSSTSDHHSILLRSTTTSSSVVH